MMPRQPIPIYQPLNLKLRPLTLQNMPLLTLRKLNPDLLSLIKAIVLRRQRIRQTRNVALGVQGRPGLDARRAFAGLEHEEQSVEARGYFGEGQAEKEGGGGAVVGEEVVELIGVVLLGLSESFSSSEIIRDGTYVHVVQLVFAAAPDGVV